MDRPGIRGGSTCLGRARSPSSPTAAPRPGAGDRAQEAGDQELARRQPDYQPVVAATSLILSAIRTCPSHHGRLRSGWGRRQGSRAAPGARRPWRRSPRSRPAARAGCTAPGKSTARRRRPAGGAADRGLRCTDHGSARAVDRRQRGSSTPSRAAASAMACSSPSSRHTSGRSGYRRRQGATSSATSETSSARCSSRRKRHGALSSGKERGCCPR